jgi:hypothetical protein
MIKKIYLSRTQTRAMSIDHPIGDPTGGPAYGEKNDPISAAISIGTMFTVAEAGFAAMTLMQGITFAGAAVSLLGNITGNSSLMKLGAIAGIAGGIGSFAESQGLFSSGNLSETLGMKSSVTDEMLKGTANVTPVTNGVQTGGPSVVETATTSAIPKPNIESVNIPPGDVNVAGGAGAGADVNVAGGSGTRSLNMNPAVDPLNPGTNILGKPNPAMSYAEGVKGPQSFGPVKPGFMDSLKAGNLGDAASAAGSGAMDMLKNNPTGAYVAAQAIGGVADWLSGKTDSEIAALKANTGFADAKAQEVQLAIAKEERRRLNMANRYTSVSPQANTTVSAAPNIQAPGLVAANMQTRPV